MRNRIIVPFLATLVLISVHLAQAQQTRVYHVGVIHEGGPFYAVVDGLKDGLRELGLAEGKHYVLEIHDLKGVSSATEAVARNLEREKVDLIFAVPTSVTTAVKRATTAVPIVFAVGTDPVVAGLVQTFARPGGRLTGVHYQQVADVTAKRLEILKQLLPNLHRVMTFYDPGNAAAVAAAKAAEQAARQLDIEIVGRPVASVHELRLALKALKAQEVDAYFYTSDAMVASEAPFIINTARLKRLPTMFTEPSLVAQGALISYGVTYHEVGRLSAKYVKQVLTGISPQSLPVESLSSTELAVNLKTAREIGVTIPQAVLQRADEVVQ
jgi:putative ABC transport system substrate-binding protein